MTVKADFHETVLKLRSDIGQFVSALKRMHETKPNDPKADVNYKNILKLHDSKTLAFATEEAQRSTLDAGMRAGKP